MQPTITQIFMNLASAFPIAIVLVITIIALFGLYVGLEATFHLWKHVTGDIDGQITPKSQIPARLILAAAMIVAPLVMWDFANTVVAGGQTTAQMMPDVFAYSGSSGTPGTLPYCKQFSTAITLFFMMLGLIGIGYAFNTANAVMAGVGRAPGYGQAWIFFIGGVLCFFVNDVAVILSNTIGLNVGLTNICATLNP